MRTSYPHIDKYIKENLVNKFIRLTNFAGTKTIYVIDYNSYLSVSINEFGYVFKTYCIETNKKGEFFSLYESEIVDLMENKKNYYYQIEIIG
jgi:hypothetical protein